MEETVFADNDNFKEVHDQLRFIWFRNLLIQTGMDLENCFPDSDDPHDQTIEQKLKLKNILSDNKIFIVDNNDDSLMIYIQDQLIGQWNKPRYDKREDLSQRGKRNKYYIGINLNYWSVFDEIES